jgi:hypothetical protein
VNAVDASQNGDAASPFAQMQINFEAGWRESVVQIRCRVTVINWRNAGQPKPRGRGISIKKAELHACEKDHAADAKTGAE